MKIKKRIMVLSLLLVLSAAYVIGALYGPKVGAVSVAKAEAPQKTATELAGKSKSAVSMDYKSGKVAFGKNAHDRLEIASMVKVMTALVVFEAIERGDLSLSDMVVASPNAASMGGSQAFLDANSEYKVEELLKTIIVASANDSCVALAERIAGSVEGFVDLMNARAAELGMKDTYYANCTGLPAPNQYSSAYDVALKMRALLRHEKFLELAQVWMFDFEHPSGRKTSLSNTNKLLKGYQGCDGGKTGFTNDAMHCLAATAVRGGMRAIAVVVGAPDSKTRFFETSSLLNDIFANYENKVVVVAGIELAEKANVPKSKQKELAVAAKDDLTFFDIKRSDKELTTEVVLDALSAPISEGATVGRIILKANGEAVCETELIALHEITKISYFDIIDEFVANW